MMNMLLGILVDVVGRTADQEKALVNEAEFREAVRNLLQTMDENDDYLVSKSEFLAMYQDDLILKALQAMDVKDSHFEVYMRLLYGLDDNEDSEEKVFTYDDITDVILRLRPGSQISQLDVAALAKVLNSTRDNLKSRLERAEARVRLLVSESQKKQEAPVRPDSNGSATCQAEEALEAVTCQSVRVSRPMIEESVTDEADDSALKRPKSSFRLGVCTVTRLQSTPSRRIVEELRRRLGVADIGAGSGGAPFLMLDEEMRAKASEDFRNIPGVLNE